MTTIFNVRGLSGAACRDLADRAVSMKTVRETAACFGIGEDLPFEDDTFDGVGLVAWTV